MKGKANNNTWGLICGIFLGGFHLVWALLIAAGVAQALIDWIFKLHMIRPPYVIAPFDALLALMLVVVTFVIGYIMGWVLAAICNAFCKK
ncbi:MAG: hypothetical protein PHU42_00260 [Patescibacteria group bacterium]|nr:hypothetical protein [Patescibacteria group bacterium]